MTTRIPCTPFGKKMKIAMVEQDIPQQELAKRLGLANSTVSDIIYGRNQCERTKKRIADTLGIKG
ncbi:MAG: helix-turn-helix transcriptional regulator [Hungatella hathewayi]|nr:helix-turn-helix transcriptional regulator [Hungatella hathewayi]